MIDDGKCGVTLGYQAHLFFLFRHGGYLLPFYDVILVRHFTFVVFTPFRTLHLFSFYFSQSRINANSCPSAKGGIYRVSPSRSDHTAAA